MMRVCYLAVVSISLAALAGCSGLPDRYCAGNLHGENFTQRVPRSDVAPELVALAEKRRHGTGSFYWYKGEKSEYLYCQVQPLDPLTPEFPDCGNSKVIYGIKDGRWVSIATVITVCGS